MTDTVTSARATSLAARGLLASAATEKLAGLEPGSDDFQHHHEEALTSARALVAGLEGLAGLPLSFPALNAKTLRARIEDMKFDIPELGTALRDGTDEGQMWGLAWEEID